MKLFLLASAPVYGATPDYGFPRCYVTFDNYETNFDDARANHEVRPIAGVKRMPYSGGSASSCSNEMQTPFIGLGPHWSPIGVTQYVRKESDTNCKNCLPSSFKTNTLIVASHGSWNRDPFIGYRVHAYEVDMSSVPYQVVSQKTLLPPLRHSTSGKRLRPVDVKTSPVDDALLMTADRDDLYNIHTGGGLYRIRMTTPPNSDSSNTGAAAESVPFTTQLNALGENPADVALERIAAIPCARQITISPNDNTIVYISTYGGFCPAKSMTGGGDSIWVLQLDSTESRVVKGPVILFNNLNGPQGMDTTVDPSNNAKTIMYIATTGDSTSRRGNSVLEVKDVDTLASAVLNGGTAITGSDTSTLTTLSSSFTRTQGQHAWRSVRVHPDGEFLIVTVGADCNWDTSCTDNGGSDKQTTLVRISLESGSKGQYSIAARGIRNSIGLHWDTNKNLIFTSFGSDRAAGIPGAASANNVPDCAVEVLQTALIPTFEQAKKEERTSLPGSSFHFCIRQVAQANTCSCSGGVAATGSACTTNGGNICASCSAGYRKSGDSCLQNICSCDGGTPASGSSCTFHDSNTCSNCNAGFRLDGSVCVANSCTCSNGSPASGSACTTNSAEICASCSAGYTLSGNRCVVNVCTCQDGTPVTGADCDVNGEEKCASCDPGFGLDIDACIPNLCTCTGGTAASGQDCVENASENCASCDASYLLNGNVCSATNTCVCEGGTAAVGQACTKDKQNICASCDDGFDLKSNACQRRKCVCQNGKPAEATCTADGAAVCEPDGCNPGFTFQPSDSSCQANTCLCPDGLPATGESCTSQNGSICASCDVGFHLVNNSCQRNVCTCGNGTAAVDDDCKINGSENCASCDENYTVTTNLVDPPFCTSNEPPPGQEWIDAVRFTLRFKGSKDFTSAMLDDVSFCQDVMGLSLQATLDNVRITEIACTGKVERRLQAAHPWTNVLFVDYSVEASVKEEVNAFVESVNEEPSTFVSIVTAVTNEEAERQNKEIVFEESDLSIEATEPFEQGQLVPIIQMPMNQFPNQDKFNGTLDAWWEEVVANATLEEAELKNDTRVDDAEPLPQEKGDETIEDVVVADPISSAGFLVVAHLISFLVLLE